jgi:hypothetical protein
MITFKRDIAPAYGRIEVFTLTHEARPRVRSRTKRLADP